MTGLALRLSITDRCDLRCFYCSPGGACGDASGELLTFEEIERAVRLLVRCGVVKVRLTGGEPLVRDGVADLLPRLERISGIVRTLTTNGQRLAPLVPALRRAGFSRVNLSVDSLRPGSFRRITGGGDLARTLEGSAAAEKAGLSPVKWNVVVMDGWNADEVAEFAAATLSRPIHVRFIEYMPTEGRESTWRRRFVSSGETLERIRRRHPLEPCVAEPHSPARLFRIPGAKGRIGFISPMSRPFCSECNRLRLSARGYLYLCLSRETGLDLRSLFRRGANDLAIETALREVIAGKRNLLHPPESGIRPIEGMSAVGG